MPLSEKLIFFDTFLYLYTTGRQISLVDSGVVLDFLVFWELCFSRLIFTFIIIIFEQSTLRENSMELESAKKLLSEKEVVIRNLEEKLVVCQSELDSKEKRLNDVEVRMVQFFYTNISTNSL